MVSQLLGQRLKHKYTHASKHTLLGLPMIYFRILKDMSPRWPPALCPETLMTGWSENCQLWSILGSLLSQRPTW